ncbi:MAG: hypothetical protein J0H98_06705 [Solirubrobacterales bacterium]|nr:hypothetical protein [Solirubrobacterales bacterium]
MPITPPRRGYTLWDPVQQPANPADHFGIADSVRRMASMGANVARVSVSWGGSVFELPPLQDGPNSSWVDDQLEHVHELVEEGRKEREDFKALITFDGLPSWVDGVSRNGHFTYTEAGCEQYGAAVVHVLNVLGEDCGWIEIGNEVNQVQWVMRPGGELGLDSTKPVSRENPPRKDVADPSQGPRDPDNPHAGDAPNFEYSRMVAYAIDRVDNCADLRRDDGAPEQQVLAGSIAIRGGADSWVSGLDPEDYVVMMRDNINFGLFMLCQTDNARRLRMQRSWGLSTHLYPRLGHNLYDTSGNLVSYAVGNNTGDMTGEDAKDTVADNYEVFASSASSGGWVRDVWITETGISSHKVGLTEQAIFHSRLWNYLYDKQTQLRGVINFGFTDLDPMMVDPNGAYREMGVISPATGLPLKPSGSADTNGWTWAGWI